MQCPSCHNEAPAESTFCPSCGTQLDDALASPLADAPTSMPSPDEALTSVDPADAAGSPAPGDAPTSAEPPQTPLSLSDSGQHGRFLPGTTVADRYRIVGLLGRGGMGEVYRADDLKLGQQVALKFLPKKFMADDVQVERLFDEVRSARKVSHPNVCRVWDIGEAEGQHYVSMEYVDGEDLSSLLRRIGRLPKDKAVEISRQLCAALAAAHDEGVLHRDLKPANIMLDGRGRVKLTDFGLAAVAEVRAGTPIYMAPEQLAGEEVSVQSDVYSLGLVLHELFTGNRVFEAGDLEELKRQHERSMTASLTSTSDLDPAVDRVINRCLEAKPSQRPKSALAVAAGLPGADPLAAALAAGETPSPEMVAEAGGEGKLALHYALPMLLAVLAIVAANFYISPLVFGAAYVPLNDSPAVLESRAVDILERLGYDEPTYSISGLQAPQAYFDWLLEQDPAQDRFSALSSGRPPVIEFWYRGSPRPFAAGGRSLGVGQITFADPPTDFPGMVRLRLDTTGRLTYLDVRPGYIAGPGADVEADSEVLFEAMGLLLADFEPAEPAFAPQRFAARRSAWLGAFPEEPEVELRIEAAATGGRWVSLRMFPEYDPLEEPSLSATGGPQIIVNAIMIALIVAGVMLARRNVMLGRGDVRGARRLGTAFALMTMLTWLLEGGPGVSNFFSSFAYSAGLGGLAWSFYVVLEPVMRRRQPHTIIGWTRLLNGGLRDPLVGRDVLAGAVVGVLLALTSRLIPLFVEFRQTGGPVAHAFNVGSDVLLATALATIFTILPTAGLISFGVYFLYVLFLVIVGNQWVAGALWLLLVSGALFSGAGFDPLSLVLFGVLAATLIRLGVLAFVCSFVVAALTGNGAALFTTDFSAWYAIPVVVPMVFVAGLATWAFYICADWTPSDPAALFDD